MYVTKQRGAHQYFTLKNNPTTFIINKKFKKKRNFQFEKQILKQAQVP